MSLIPRNLYPMTYESPMDRMLYRTLNDTMRDFDRSLNTLAPYWMHTPTLHECNIGNTIGNIVNDKEKFGVNIDVTQFRPDELEVKIRERELTIEGRHEERMDETGRIERHFVRKYMIPEDVNMDTLESHLSDRGTLSIWGKKLAVEGKKLRNIPIKAAPREKWLKEHKKDKTEERK